MRSNGRSNKKLFLVSGLKFAAKDCERVKQTKKELNGNFSIQNFIVEMTKNRQVEQSWRVRNVSEIVRDGVGVVMRKYLVGKF